jgi:hypothetical protein
MNQEMNNMVTFSIVVVGLLHFGYNVLGWCRDPLALRLQEEIDMLNEELESSRAECDFLRERLSSAGHHIRSLKRVLNTDTDSDTEPVSLGKRPRVNT